MGDLSQVAIAQHEMYTAWVEAGFTPDQAMELVKVTLLRALSGDAE
jgi:hypothetical protein